MYLSKDKIFNLVVLDHLFVAQNPIQRLRENTLLGLNNKNPPMTGQCHKLKPVHYVLGVNYRLLFLEDLFRKH